MRSVLSEEELDKTTLLTYGLEERVAEGSGLSDGESLLLSQADYGRCDDSVVRTTDRNYILYTHNRLRSKLAQGRQPNKEGMMSSGKNVYLLKWDCDLERLAHDWAKTCPKFPVANAKIPSGSQLVKIFDISSHGNNISQHIDDSMRSWWLEYKKHGNVDYKNRYSHRQSYYGWANVRYFIFFPEPLIVVILVHIAPQMAKGKATRIGCSYSVCESHKTIFTCVYNAKAHCEKRTIYEPGLPCQSDDDCSTYPNSRCISTLGLCQAPDIPGGN
ncbi:SCP-like protein [Necator americanus]|uniref:SCP-like protein n=1 Tax=Necator americanus TaxID=51031 RepID=W2TWM1_NECAM|nr:SCP-like protein [Necator americanus]ETN85461.1 SCP-like protein [Necator americanus]